MAQLLLFAFLLVDLSTVNGHLCVGSGGASFGEGARVDDQDAVDHLDRN